MSATKTEPPIVKSERWCGKHDCPKYRTAGDLFECYRCCDEARWAEEDAAERAEIAEQAPYIAKAKELYDEGPIHVTGKCEVAEDGAYVMAWVWIPNPGIGENLEEPKPKRRRSPRTL